MSEPLVVADRIGCRFSRPTGRFQSDSFWALRDLSFELFRGQSLAVLGRNGSGKSTLLQMLAGILSPDAGTLQIHARSATLLSLNAGLQPTLTGRDNAILTGMLLGVTRAEIVERLDDIRTLSGLKEFFDMPVAIYSAGMRARLGFSAIYHLDPEIMLIDEVLGVGDKDFKKVSAGLMRERIRSDRTVVLVSHSSAQIRELCDRAMWIEGGKLVSIGSVDEVTDAYEDAA